MLLRGCLALALTLACTPTDRPAPASRPAPRQAGSTPPPEQPTSAPETETPPESPVPLPIHLRVEVLAQTTDRAKTHALASGWIAVADYNRLMLVAPDGSIVRDLDVLSHKLTPGDSVNTITGRWPDAVYAHVLPSKQSVASGGSRQPIVYHWQDGWREVDREHGDLTGDAREVEETPSGLIYAIGGRGKTLGRCAEGTCRPLEHVEQGRWLKLATAGESALIWDAKGECGIVNSRNGTCVMQIDASTSTAFFLPELSHIPEISASPERTLWMMAHIASRPHSFGLWRRTTKGDLRPVHVHVDGRTIDTVNVHARDRPAPLIVARMNHGFVLTQPVSAASP